MGAKRGRPCTYTPEIGDAICSRLAEGETVEAICRDPGMPSASIVRLWASNARGSEENGAPGFFEAYARAICWWLMSWSKFPTPISSARTVAPTMASYKRRD